MKATISPARHETRVVEVEPEKVVLELSKEQALSLAMVCNRIGGNPAHTRRGDFDQLSHALRKVGVYWDYSEGVFERSITNGLYFREGV